MGSPHGSGKWAVQFALDDHDELRTFLVVADGEARAIEVACEQYRWEADAAASIVAWPASERDLGRYG